jgi:hypothetical protein
MLGTIGATEGKDRAGRGQLVDGDTVRRENSRGHSGGSGINLAPMVASSDASVVFIGSAGGLIDVVNSSGVKESETLLEPQGSGEPMAKGAPEQEVFRVGVTSLGTAPRKAFVRSLRQVRHDFGPGLGWYGHNRVVKRGRRPRHASRAKLHPSAVVSSDRKMIPKKSRQRLKATRSARDTPWRAETMAMMTSSLSQSGFQLINASFGMWICPLI